jgi:hypothetical protein
MSSYKAKSESLPTATRMGFVSALIGSLVISIARIPMVLSLNGAKHLSAILALGDGGGD